MLSELPNDVQQELARQMSSGRYQSEADVLRRALSALSAEDADLAAVQAGVDDMEAGRMQPLSEITAEIRRRHGWSSPEWHTMSLLTRAAKKQLNALADYIAIRSSEAAQQWFNGILHKLNSLSHFPERGGFARENPHFPFVVRQILFGRRRNYRVIYTVRARSVIVLAIRHSSQDELQAESLLLEWLQPQPHQHGWPVRHW
jgi:plasmid stabilization system protein ParE/Arc/MetJ-type ribon-helix-helix transcriptional regulator